MKINQKYIDELTKDWSKNWTEEEKVFLMLAQLVTNAFPTVSDFISIQPMNGPVTTSFYMDFKYAK